MWGRQVETTWWNSGVKMSSSQDWDIRLVVDRMNTLTIFVCHCSSFGVFRYMFNFHQVVAVSKIIVNKAYDSVTKENDLALLKLKQPLVFNQYVRPIDLWMAPLPLFSKCTITGWGATRESKELFWVTEGTNWMRESKCWLFPQFIRWSSSYHITRGERDRHGRWDL